MFRKMMAVVLVLIFGLVTLPANAQPQKGLYGVSINLTNGFFTSQKIVTPAGPYTVGVIYLPSEILRLRADIGFRSQKDINGNKESEFAFTANVWRYFATEENVTPFLGGAVIIGSASATTTSGLLGIGVGGGAEYWVAKRFSVYGQLNFIYGHYSVSGKSAEDFYTSATAGVCWYF